MPLGAAVDERFYVEFVRVEQESDERIYVVYFPVGGYDDPWFADGLPGFRVGFVLRDAACGEVEQSGDQDDQDDEVREERSGKGSCGAVHGGGWIFGG